MRIPLPRMLRAWRRQLFDRRRGPHAARFGLRVWAMLATRPGLYRALTRATVAILAWLGRSQGAFRSLPLTGSWSTARDLPAPEGGTFVTQWQGKQGP